MALKFEREFQVAVAIRVLPKGPLNRKGSCQRGEGGEGSGIGCELIGMPQRQQPNTRSTTTTELEVSSSTEKVSIVLIKTELGAKLAVIIISWFTIGLINRN